MAETLKEVIARIKAQTQPNSQQFNQQQAPQQFAQPQQYEQQPQQQYGAVKPRVEEPMPFQVDDDEEPMPVEAPRVQQQAQAHAPAQLEATRQQQILMEIEMLQNNGRYRAELLAQLQEMNKAMVLIASLLADLHGKK